MKEMLIKLDSLETITIRMIKFLYYCCALSSFILSSLFIY